MDAPVVWFEHAEATLLRNMNTCGKSVVRIPGRSLRQCWRALPEWAVGRRGKLWARGLAVGLCEDSGVDHRMTLCIGKS